MRKHILQHYQGIFDFILSSSLCVQGGAVASWLVRSFLDRAVRVRALAGDTVLTVVFLDKKTLFSHSASFHPGVQMGTGQRLPANLMLGITLQWTSIPSTGEQKYSKPLHATEIGDKHQPDEPLSSYTDLRWYGTLNMDQKVCLNMVKKDQLCAIALKKRN